MRSPSVAFVSVGANIAPQRNIRAALTALKGQTRVVGSSTFYETEPLGRRDQPRYVNGVWRIETDILAPHVKAALLQPIEQSLGRVRTGDKYAPRTIDLDLVLYEDLVIDDEDLTLPHPDIARPFVYFPVVELLREMLPEWSGDLAARMRLLLPTTIPKEPPGEPLERFTQELKQLFRR
jgi:2-amino-4-hydroxy-6-hydroxymethyldihydropteridine diphosphokinase